MTVTLNTYLKQVQRLCRDPQQRLMNPEDLIDYINLARREIAMRSQSIRRLPRIAGAVTTIDVTDPGSGYTAPTVTITPPDFPDGLPGNPAGLQATAIATQIGGQIAGINIENGGSGYFQPIVTINDPTGTGATGIVNTSALNVTVESQEVYPFSGVDLTPFPGVRAIFAVLSISIIYANYRYSLPRYSFSTYQAFIRQYPFQYQYVPTMCSQFGQGTDGSLYTYPLASQAYQMDWDCLCLPDDLNTNNDAEALPEPWTDAVPYMAAKFAMMEMQNWNSARALEEQFNQFVSRYSTYTRPSRWVNPYGRF